MPCYHPLTAYTLPKRAANGKQQITFKRTTDGIMRPIALPCGQCIGCRLDRSLDWAVRISNEASLYDKNCFITLTYAPEHEPDNGSLVVSHYQKFMKRLRKRFPNETIRFFQCGEYGENLGRPHYHACLLNFDFPDKILHRRNERGEPIYRSPILEDLWPFGFSEIGDVTFDSAAYVARYVTKKISGPMAEAHYSGRLPEYTTMSRRPGIGKPWLDKYATDVYPHDRIALRSGATIQPPRFYDKQFEIMEPTKFAKIHRKRTLKRHKADLDPVQQLERTYERRIVKETVHKATVSRTLNRKLESDLQ